MSILAKTVTGLFACNALEAITNIAENKTNSPTLKKSLYLVNQVFGKYINSVIAFCQTLLYVVEFYEYFPYVASFLNGQLVYWSLIMAWGGVYGLGYGINKIFRRIFPLPEAKTNDYKIKESMARFSYIHAENFKKEMLIAKSLLQLPLLYFGGMSVISIVTLLSIASISISIFSIYKHMWRNCDINCSFRIESQIKKQMNQMQKKAGINQQSNIYDLYELKLRYNYRVFDFTAKLDKDNEKKIKEFYVQQLIRDRLYGYLDYLQSKNKLSFKYTFLANYRMKVEYKFENELKETIDEEFIINFEELSKKYPQINSIFKIQKTEYIKETKSLVFTYLNKSKAEEDISIPVNELYQFLELPNDNDVQISSALSTCLKVGFLKNDFDQMIGLNLYNILYEILLNKNKSLEKLEVKDNHNRHLGYFYKSNISDLTFVNIYYLSQIYNQDVLFNEDKGLDKDKQSTPIISYFDFKKSRLECKDYPIESGAFRIQILYKNILDKLIQWI